MDLDTSYLNSDPNDQFITMENASHKRGRFELAFSQIGGLVLLGSGIGSVQGLYSGMHATKQYSGAVRRTQLINYVIKRQSATSRTLGTIAVLYTGIGTIMYKARDDKEDMFNTIGAASLTGALFASPGGLRRAGIG